MLPRHMARKIQSCFFDCCHGVRTKRECVSLENFNSDSSSFLLGPIKEIGKPWGITIIIAMFATYQEVGCYH